LKSLARFSIFIEDNARLCPGAAKCKPRSEPKDLKLENLETLRRASARLSHDPVSNFMISGQSHQGGSRRQVASLVASDHQCRPLWRMKLPSESLTATLEMTMASIGAEPRGILCDAIDDSASQRFRQR
jgi:hypothetical protein